MKYWAVGINGTIDDNFLSKNEWSTDYDESKGEGLNHRGWINHKMSIGDKVALKKINRHTNSLNIYAIGVVQEKYKDYSGFKINWEKLNPIRETSSSFGQAKTISQVINKEAKKEIFGLFDKVKKESNMNVKNIILYGSPGVGKTHNIQEIISYIEGGLPEKDIFSRISNNEKVSSHNILYKNLVYENRVKFVTFHQSFGYEDFIEGFRPNKKGNIELVDGIFKEICRKEKIKLFPIYTSINTFKTNCHDNTIDVGQIIHEFNDIVTTKSPVKEIRLEEDSFVILFENNLSISITDEELYNCLLDFIDDNFDTDDIRTMAIDLRKNRYIDILARFYIEWIKKINHFVELKTVCKDIVKTESKSIQKNKYLVIDEINRGNISKIFGELITLIEEDKRDTLEVTLPYSKKPFKIPSNLYIIGTMNSTDKSIALIDIALRRRFTFLKMEPNLNLVTHAKAKNIMKQLNEKITDILGSDYVLGHSYFMKIVNDDDLEFVLEYKIIPLLEEYFYGDDQGLKSVMQIVRYDGDDDTE